MAFKIRSRMLENIPENFKSKFMKFGEDALICPYRTTGGVLGQRHCMVCPAWEGIRETLDMSSMVDLVVFFQRLMFEIGKLRRLENASCIALILAKETFC